MSLHSVDFSDLDDRVLTAANIGENVSHILGAEIFLEQLPQSALLTDSFEADLLPLLSERNLALLAVSSEIWQLSR